MKNAMHRTGRSTGQSIYEVMLILSCAAMALAVFFTAYEYVSYYHGEAKTVPPLGHPTANVARPAPRTAAAPAVTPAPATTAAPTAAPGTTPAPATTP
jgi:hypothetical protein